MTGALLIAPQNNKAQEGETWTCGGGVGREKAEHGERERGREREREIDVIVTIGEMYSRTETTTLSKL